MAALNPWEQDKYRTWERSFKIHGLEFVVTNDPPKEPDGRAIFSADELSLLRQAAGGAKLPKDLSLLLHKIKTTLGGTVTKCSVDTGVKDL